MASFGTMVEADCVDLVLRQLSSVVSDSHQTCSSFRSLFTGYLLQKSALPSFWYSGWAAVAADEDLVVFL